MKKVIFFLLLCVCFFSVKAQYPISQNIGAPTTLVVAKGGLKADSTFIVPAFTDTAKANLSNYIKVYPGALIRVQDTIFMRNKSATQWLPAITTAAGTVSLVNSGYGLTGGPITSIGTLKADTSVSGLSGKYVRIADTSSMLSNYATKALANSKIDSLKRSSDSIYARKNGQWVFQYKDSTGGGTTPTLQQVLNSGNSISQAGGTSNMFFSDNSNNQIDINPSSIILNTTANDEILSLTHLGVNLTSSGITAVTAGGYDAGGYVSALNSFGNTLSLKSESTLMKPYISWYNNPDGVTQNLFPQYNVANSDIYMPYANPVDTLATLFDVRNNVPATPNLQQVTNVGNYTTNSMVVDDGSGLFTTIASNSVGTEDGNTGTGAFLDSDGRLSLSNGTRLSSLYNTNVTSIGVDFELPNAASGNHTIPISVNGIASDVNGNINVSTQNGRFGNDTATIVMAKVHNDAGVTLTNGKVVAFSTSGTSSNAPSVKLANNKADSTSATTFGFVSGTIAVNDTGYVILLGKIEKLNTSAFANGDIIYLDSISGQYTKSKPQAPYHLVYLGTVVKANAGNGAIYVRVANGYELEELHNVKITSPQNNQVLAYSDTQQLWKNRNIYSIVDTTTTVATKSNVALKLNISDTTTMLSPYVNAAGYGLTKTSKTISADTSKLSTLYQTNLRVKYTDTATMLTPYLRKSDTTSLSNRINLKLNISDTASMLNPYLRKADTVSLSNRINLKLNISDTSSMLNPYLRKIDTTNKFVNTITRTVGKDSIIFYIGGTRYAIKDSTGGGAAAAGSTGYVQFNTSGAFNGDANLFWDNTNKRLGIGTSSPSEKFSVSGSGASTGGRIWSQIENTNNSSAAGLKLKNGDGRFASFQYSGSTYLAGEAFSIYTENDFPIIFNTNGGNPSGGTSYISFSPGGYSNESVRFFGSKNVGVGTTTDAGYKLDVNGTGRFTSDFTCGGRIEGTNIGATGQLQALAQGVAGSLTARTTNAAGSYTPVFMTGSNLGSAGSLQLNYETTNQLSFSATNASALKVARAGIGIASLTNTAGAESGDLTFLTQSGGTAMSEKMRIFGGGNIGIGTSTDAGYKLDVNGTTRLQGSTTITSGTLTNGANGLKVTATLPTTATQTNNGIDYQITSAGTSSQTQAGLNVSLLPGYTGPYDTYSIFASNTTAGTGTTYHNSTCNMGAYFNAGGTTIGTNVGNNGIASNGNKNIGLFGRATTAKNSATNVGVLGMALNTGTSPIQIGGYFALSNADQSLTSSSALMCDNGSTTSDIFVARDNGTAMFSIKDNGSVNYSATNTATGTTGNQTINKPSGTVNIAAAGTSITVTNSLVTANSIVFAVIRTNDATATIKNVVPSAGSFTINLNAAATAETSIGFFVIN